MHQPSHHPTSHSTTGYPALTIIFFPFALYLLQLLGRISLAAACAGGVLLIVKVIFDWRALRAAPPVKRTPRGPLAGCYYCGDLRPLCALQRTGYRIGVCRQCYSQYGASHRH